MSMMTRPRGPLPARVYWVRRLLLLSVALLLVFGIAHLLGSGGTGGVAARPVGADASVGAASPTPSTRPSPTAVVKPAKGRKAAAATKTPLAAPTGPCSGSDVEVTPGVRGTAYAGTAVTFDLKLTTARSPACNWVVSARSLVVKLTSGVDRIWSTQDCKGVVRKQQVVVRKDVPTTVTVIWRGQRSDGSCSRSMPWAEPGFYHVTAAALGAEPTETQFELHEPVTVTITPSPSPSPTPSDEPSGKGAHGTGGQKPGAAGSSGHPSASPSKSD
ncbi:MAG: hypothetical protein ACXVFU_17370 [Nocardioidaceae bacterium]